MKFETVLKILLICFKQNYRLVIGSDIILEKNWLSERNVNSKAEIIKLILASLAARQSNELQNTEACS